jgi:hypothetical protein
MKFLNFIASAVLLCVPVFSQNSSAPRKIRIEGQRFIVAATGEPIVMIGPNVVVKGFPYLPSVEGDSICNDNVNDECASTGTCTTCYTFNKADAEHFLAMGWNTIRCYSFSAPHNHILYLFIISA